MELTDKEKKILEAIRKVKFGEVIVYIEDNKPVRVKETVNTKI